MEQLPLWYLIPVLNVSAFDNCYAFLRIGLASIHIAQRLILKAGIVPKKKSTPAESSSSNVGETHQQSSRNGVILTTNQGLPISDNQNSLKAGGRGPTLLEDFRNWRRGRDSNPRYPFGYAGFQDRCHQPLGHLSAIVEAILEGA